MRAISGAPPTAAARTSLTALEPTVPRREQIGLRLGVRDRPPAAGAVDEGPLIGADADAGVPCPGVVGRIEGVGAAALRLDRAVGAAAAACFDDREADAR